MSEFQTTAEILFEADQDSLRSIRDEVADIGPLTVEYEPSRNPAARSASRLGRTDGGRGSVGGRQTRSILTDIRDLQEDTLVELEDMSDDLGGGQSGPLEVITGVIGDVGGEAAGATAETVGSVGGTAAGSALGTLAGELLAGTLGSGEGSGGAPKPVPIASEDTPVAVEDATLDVETPTLTVDDPSPLTIDDTNLPLPVERVDPIPVNAPRSIPVAVGDTTLSARATATAISAGGPTASRRPTPAPSRGGYDGPGFVESVTGTAEFGANVGSSSLGGLGPPGILAGALGGTVAGGIGGALGYGLNRIDYALTGDTGAGGSPSPRPTPRQSVDVDVTADRRSTITVDVTGVDRLKQDVIDEVERMHDKDVRELERELDKLRRALTQ